jgi:hypothetical protein
VVQGTASVAAGREAPHSVLDCIFRLFFGWNHFHEDLHDVGDLVCNKSAPN